MGKKTVRGKGLAAGWSQGKKGEKKKYTVSKGIHILKRGRWEILRGIS